MCIFTSYCVLKTVLFKLKYTGTKGLAKLLLLLFFCKILQNLFLGLSKLMCI